MSGGTYNSNHDTMSLDMLRSSRVNADQTNLSKFMQKPLQFFTSYTTTSTAGVPLVIDFGNQNIDLPETLITSSSTRDVFWKKAFGNLAFRGTVKAVLTVNATRFQQGRLIMHFVPGGQYENANPTDSVGVYLRNRSLNAITQQKRVELDVSKDSSVEMLIPYRSPNPFYNLADGTGGVGQLFVTPYTPLAVGTGGVTDVHVTLYLSFEDVEFETPHYTAESGVAESLEAADKPISKALGVAATVASSLAAIPKLAPVMLPASAVAHGLQGIASSFGWSKPLSDDAARTIEGQTVSNMANCSGVSNANNLGLYHDCETRVSSGIIGTQEDEMSINFLVRVPSFVQQATWTTGEDNRTTIMSFPVCPQQWLSAKTNYYDGPPLSMLSLFFKFWRGSIKLRFKFVKTDMHSGRVVVYFNPQGNEINFGNDSIAGPYVFREVWDIRSKSEFDVTLPYALTREWLKNLQFDEAGTPEPMGYFSMMVLNELRGPDTVAQSVTVLCEVMAGDDFAFSVPMPLATADGEGLPYLSADWSAESGGSSACHTVNGTVSTRIVASAAVDRPCTISLTASSSSVSGHFSLFGIAFSSGTPTALTGSNQSDLDGYVLLGSAASFSFSNATTPVWKTITWSKKTILPAGQSAYLQGWSSVGAGDRSTASIDFGETGTVVTSGDAPLWVSDINYNAESGIANSLVSDRNGMHDAACVGEIVQSIKNLCLRYTKTRNFDGSEDAASSAKTFRIYANCAKYATNTPGTLFGGDYPHVFSAWYAWSSGSLRLLNVSRTNRDNVHFKLAIDDTTTPFSTSETSIGADRNAIATQICGWPSGRPLAEVQVPSYQQLPLRANRFSWYDGVSNDFEPMDEYAPPVHVAMNTTNGGLAAESETFIAGADNFALHNFVGVMPISRVA